jgi:hypothetical protein
LLYIAEILVPRTRGFYFVTDTDLPTRSDNQLPENDSRVDSLHDNRLNLENLRPITRSLTRSNNNNIDNTDNISSTPSYRVKIQVPSINNYKDTILPVVGEYNRALYTISDTMLKDLMNSLERKEEVADFLLTTTTNKEPNGLREALESPNREQWLKACREEVTELESQDTYEIVDLPPRKIPIKGRWVFKQKPISNPNHIKKGHITDKDKTFRYKAR